MLHELVSLVWLLDVFAKDPELQLLLFLHILLVLLNELLMNLLDLLFLVLLFDAFDILLLDHFFLHQIDALLFACNVLLWEEKGSLLRIDLVQVVPSIGRVVGEHRSGVRFPGHLLYLEGVLLRLYLLQLPVVNYLTTLLLEHSDLLLSLLGLLMVLDFSGNDSLFLLRVLRLLHLFSVFLALPHNLFVSSLLFLELHLLLLAQLRRVIPDTYVIVQEELLVLHRKYFLVERTVVL